MIQQICNLKLPSSILKIDIIDDKIYILDNKFVLLIYSNEDLTLIDKHFLIESQTDKHIYENTLALSKNLDIYHSFTKSAIGTIFNVEDDTIKQSFPIELHNRDVSYAKFSNNAKFLLIGGEDGRSCFYDLVSQRSCFSFEPRSDFISSAVFSHDDKLVCIGAYDKAIKIHNIEKHTVIAEVQVSDTPEDLIFCDDNNKVVGITRDRKIFSYNIETEELVYASMLFSEWPTAITRIGFKHLLVGTKGDILYIFNIEDLSLLRRFHVDNFGVKVLKIHKSNLYIGYSNGELKIIDLNFLNEEFEASLKANKFAKATSYMKDNIFLMTKEVTQKYDTVWEQALDMAKDLLISKNVEKAEKIIKPFLWDKRKKDAFKSMKVNINDIKHFEDLVEKNSYMVAFKFADEKEHLKTTKSYQIIETNFNKKFQLAKNLFSKETPADVQNAKSIITPYLKIESKKILINNLMQNYKVFARSTRLIKARNFKVYFKLVENNTFLKDESLYNKVVEIGNQTYSQLLQTEQEGNYEKATQVANYLGDFIPFTDKAVDVLDIIDSKLNLKNLIYHNEIKKIYHTISNSSELELSPMFTQYHKVFEAKKEEANAFANLGQSPQVKESLDGHLDIEYLRNSIAMVFKLSYLVELELAMQSDPETVNIHASLERYATLFGIDSEIHLLAKKMQFSHLVPNYPPNPTGYQTNDFFENIVVKTN